MSGNTSFDEPFSKKGKNNEYSPGFQKESVKPDNIPWNNFIKTYEKCMTDSKNKWTAKRADFNKQRRRALITD